MLPMGLIIDLSLVRRIGAHGPEALTIAATLAGESDIAFWARSRCIQSVRRRGRGSAPGAPRSAATDSAGSTWGSVLTSLGRPYWLFNFDRAISMKSGLRPAVCGCSGIVSGGPSARGSGIRTARWTCSSDPVQLSVAGVGDGGCPHERVDFGPPLVDRGGQGDAVRGSASRCTRTGTGVVGGGSGADRRRGAPWTAGCAVPPSRSTRTGSARSDPRPGFCSTSLRNSCPTSVPAPAAAVSGWPIPGSIGRLRRSRRSQVTRRRTLVSASLASFTRWK